MIYTEIQRSGVRLSRLGLGGHEYLPNGRPRGLDDPRFLIPGQIIEGFGGDRRRAVLKAAYESGINFFDVTQDSEKEALGRNLRELPPPYEVFVQTRPEAMMYDRDPGNRKMADFPILRAEVERILELLRRDHLDFLNLGLAPDAIRQPDYLDRLKDTTDRLKREGLVRFTTADSFCGEEVLLPMIHSGGFESIFLNLNAGDAAARDRVVPAAARSGMAVLAREAYMKGELFAFGAEIGSVDRPALARVALRWVLSQPGVTSVVVGAAEPEHLRAAVAAAEDPGLASDDRDLLERLRSSAGFRTYVEERARAFDRGVPPPTYSIRQ